VEVLRVVLVAGAASVSSASVSSSAGARAGVNSCGRLYLTVGSPSRVSPVQPGPVTCEQVAQAFQSVGINLAGAGGFAGSRAGHLTWPAYLELAGNGPGYFVEVILFQSPVAAKMGIDGPEGDPWRYNGYAIRRVQNIVGLVEPLNIRARFRHRTTPLPTPPLVAAALAASGERRA